MLILYFRLRSITIFYLFCCLNLPILAMGKSSIWLSCPFDILSLMWALVGLGLVLKFSTSLLYGHIRLFKLILCISCLSPRISHFFPRSHGSFYWRRKQETNIWELNGLDARNTLLVLIYVYILICVDPHVYKDFYAYLSVSILS